MKEIEKDDQNLETSFKISKWHGDLEHFINFILEYFELDKVLEDKHNEKYDYPKEYLYYGQEHKLLNYVEYFLREIKPFLPLAYKLSRIYDLPNKLEENSLNEDSMVNMIDNFTRLRRTGRPKKFYPEAQKDFIKFKKEYQNIIDFLQEVRSHSVKSLIDYATAIEKHKISKEQLKNYLFLFYHWRRKYKEWSRATLYRFDKDLIFLGKYYFYVKDAYKKYDFYQEILENKTI